MKQDRYYAMSTEEVFRRFQVDEDGLNNREVKKRIEKYGLNKLPEKKKDSVFKIVIRELLDPIVLLLIVAIIASLVVGELVDAIAICVIVTIDLIIGTIEEVKANNTEEAIKKLVPETVKVRRGGVEEVVDSSELTVGDFVYLESGDKISADLRIIDAHNLTIDESILTGESISVEKNAKILPNKSLQITSQKNMAFAGTTVVTGRSHAIVVGVGLGTEIGKIATTLEETEEEKSPLTIRVDEFSKNITVAIGLLSIILVILLTAKGYSSQEIFPNNTSLNPLLK